MIDQPRYAIYFAPATGSALADLGAATLGYDASRGADAPFAPGLERQFPLWRCHVAEPARYGFHATLKAPFALVPGFGEADLIDAAAVVAGRLQPASAGTFEVAAMHRHVALLPEDREAGAALAAEIVSAFDPLRAPLGEADRRRRLQTPLSPRQIALLDRWGYPFVLDEFRFHMTLAGPLEPEQLPAVHDALQRLYAPVLAPVILDAISIFRQKGRANRFVEIARLRLAGA
jgi:hypothetical protein